MGAGKTIPQMQQEVVETSTANGWHEKPRSFGDEIALLHSEVSEMFEAFREGQMVTWYEHREDCIHFPLNSLHDLQMKRDGCTCHAKPMGVPSEAADIFHRLLDFCSRYDIDLELEFDIKGAFNKTRGYKHGGKAV
jgi:hypothetical protein